MRHFTNEYRITYYMYFIYFYFQGHPHLISFCYPIFFYQYMFADEAIVSFVAFITEYKNERNLSICGFLLDKLFLGCHATDSINKIWQEVNNIWPEYHNQKINLDRNHNSLETLRQFMLIYWCTHSSHK
jgi:hypothetical protein